MKIVEDFIYYSKHSKTIEEKLGVSKQNLDDSYDSIKRAIDWLEMSCFRKLFGEIEILITDIPIIHTMAFMGIEENKKQITIMMNIVALVKSYEDKEYLSDFNFKNEVSCKEYASFIFLHEIGHLVHAGLSVTGEYDIIGKVDWYLKKYRHQYNKVAAIKNERKAKKSYRRIPPEREADNFAKRYYKEFGRNGKVN